MAAVETMDAADATDLKISGVIGFTGEVSNGLLYSPCGGFVIYPLGSIIVVKNLEDEGNVQIFLDGHSNDVTCISVSHDGKTLASGQKNHASSPAHVLIWDLETAKEACTADASGPKNFAPKFRLKQHLGRVQDLDFSCDDQYLCTLGGQDDNALVIWDVATGTAICGSPAAQDSAFTARWLNQRNDRLVTSGNYHVRVWQVDVNLPKLHAMDSKMGTMKRVIQCVTITDDDQFAYCGTKTGELLKFKIDRDPIQSFNDPDRIRPTLKEYSRDRFGKGIKSCKCWTDPTTGATNIIIGAGDGTLAMLDPSLRLVKGYMAQVMGAVTSISLSPDGQGFMVGTDQSNRYFVYWEGWSVELRGTCHCGPVNDVCFPQGCSDLFITCSIYDIRIWNCALRQELLRIQVPNLECKCVGITTLGQTIVSGWTDGKIRAFFPESGRLKFVISDAHSEAVTALAVCNDDESRPPWRIISGGDDGRVRVWKITSSCQTLAHSMKEHRATVNCIRVSADNSQCVSASADGSCIVWDLSRYVRLLALFETTVFQSVLYHPDESQILTCGENHKISYWDSSTGHAIRVITGSNKEMSTLDMDPGGDIFVSGCADKLVKVWHYDDGIANAIGTGHSGKISAVKISPDRKTVVSVGEEGAIFLWDMAGVGM